MDGLGKGLQREIAAFDSLANGFVSMGGQEKGKTDSSMRANKESATGPKFCFARGLLAYSLGGFSKYELHEFRANQRHVAGEEKDCASARGFERCVDAAEWAALGDKVVANNPNRKAGCAGGFMDDAKHGGRAEGKAGFVAAHTFAEAAGEDADFE